MRCPADGMTNVETTYAETRVRAAASACAVAFAQSVKVSIGSGYLVMVWLGRARRPRYSFSGDLRLNHMYVI